MRSSEVLANPLSDTNEKLQAYAATFHLKPEFMKLAYGRGDVDVLRNRHNYARYAYFASFDSPEAAKEDDKGRVFGLAAFSDSEIRRLLAAERFWVQDANFDRWAPEQLTFSPQPLPRQARAAGPRNTHTS